jgi:hypothetical protein
MAMSDYLFADFLCEPQEYKQAEAVWRDRWDDLVRRVGQESMWEVPWSNKYSANGTSIQDGNPIFSAISPRRKLAIRVIQLEPSDGSPEFYVWSDTFAEGSPESVKELVISCVLTQDTLNEAVELMRRWITEEKIEYRSGGNDGPISPETSRTFPSTALSENPPRSST